jgi:RNase P/RNase MRP subunit p29
MGSDTKRRRLEALYRSLDGPSEAHTSGAVKNQSPNAGGAGSAQAARRVSRAVGVAEHTPRHRRAERTTPKADSHKTAQQSPHGSARRAPSGGRGGGPGGEEEAASALCYAALPSAVIQGSAAGGFGPGVSVGGQVSRPEWVFSMLSGLMAQHPKAPADPGQLAARLEACIKRKVVFLQSERQQKAGQKAGGATASIRPRQLVTSTQAKRQHLYELPVEQRTFDTFRPLHALWMSYASAVVQGLNYEDATAPAALNTLLERLDWHGAFVTVVQCRSPALCGVEGIVVKHSAKALHVVSPANKLHILPLNGITLQAVVAHLTLRVEGTSLPPPPGTRAGQASRTRVTNASRNNVDWLGF